MDVGFRKNIFISAIIGLYFKGLFWVNILLGGLLVSTLFAGIALGVVLIYEVINLDDGYVVLLAVVEMVVYSHAFFKYSIRCTPIKFDSVNRNLLDVYYLYIVFALVTPVWIIIYDFSLISTLVMIVTTGLIFWMWRFLYYKNVVHNDGVLFLRRFGSYADEFLVQDLMRLVPKKHRLMLLIDSETKLGAWDAIGWSFSGFIGSFFNVKKACLMYKESNESWKDSVGVLINDSACVILDDSNHSESMDYEKEMIVKLQAQSKTILIKCMGCSGGELLDVFSLIDYEDKDRGLLYGVIYFLFPFVFLTGFLYALITVFPEDVLLEVFDKGYSVVIFGIDAEITLFLVVIIFPYFLMAKFIKDKGGGVISMNNIKNSVCEIVDRE